MKAKNYIYSQIRNSVVQEYKNKVQGNRVTGETRAGKNLEEENLLNLKHIDERLEISDPSEELEGIEMKRLEEVLRLYKEDLEQSEQILEDSDQDSIAYEVSQIRQRVQGILQDMELL